MNKIKECFADDSMKYKFEMEKYHKGEYVFWENFRNWDKENFFGIYGGDYGLRDPDYYSGKLYDFHKEFWNRQKEKAEFRHLQLPAMEKFNNGYYRLEGIKENKNYCLGSDSFISVYWHWKKMQPLLQKIADYIDENNENVMETEIKKMEADFEYSRKKKCFYDENWDKKDWKNKLKKFIWLYLQKANTFGGFIVFPRHASSINQVRGKAPFYDRFDLALECIRRYFTNENIPEADDEYKPLSDVLKKDEDFFRMFGQGPKGFETYIKYFCLEDWVTEDYSSVINLLPHKNTQGEYIEILKDPNTLTQNETEWWFYYNNLMILLDKRNNRIAELLSSVPMSIGIAGGK